MNSWTPTAELRFVEREVPASFDIHTSRFGAPVTLKSIRVLQQRFARNINAIDIEHEWRDVPLFSGG